MDVVSMAFVINVIKLLLWTVETRTLDKVLGRDYVLSGVYYSVLVRNTLTQCCPQSATLAQHQNSTGSIPRVCWAAFNPVNTKHYSSVSFVECFGMF